MWPVSSTELANILRSGARRNEIKDCSMRKTIKNSETELAPENASWLDLRTIARVEVLLKIGDIPSNQHLMKVTNVAGGPPSQESRPSGFFSMSRNGSGVSGSDL